MCLVVVFVVFIHAYQLKPQWKGYDDVFRGRTNAAEPRDPSAPHFLCDTLGSPRSSIIVNGNNPFPVP
ncbi:G-protein coupled receptor 98 [Microtus ochrogaster]|uniref:G-protein coupled receptor 98 n=1 Tax=Microtus ochrogaster TaxID=79684 RepID=A0A8J6KPT6_MICOH|nr:G-protein coupled receptor 98 [Microtus ochrogaster]